MTTATKMWFCFAVALVAAAVADPLVESASNAGFFGAGNFTDHSQWDVMPLLVAGIFFVTVHWLGRVRRLLHSKDKPISSFNLSGAGTLGSVLSLLPGTYALQVCILFAGETLEQWIVYHHLLGGTIWLGGPMAVSLLAHAAACMFVATTAALLLRAFADTTARLVRRIAGFAAQSSRIPRRAFSVLRARSYVVLPLIALHRVAERAPPVLA